MAEARHDGQRQNRPFSVTLVVLGVLLLGLANGWRALGLIRQSDLLLALGATPDPRICVVGAIAWAILFVGLTYALWRRKRYTRLIVPVMLLGYGLYQSVLPGPCAAQIQAQEGRSTIMVFVYIVLFLFATLALNTRAGRAYMEDA